MLNCKSSARPPSIKCIIENPFGKRIKKELPEDFEGMKRGRPVTN
jgi:hypothetical protein